MYRIIFDPKTSLFVVQILTWACLWRSCADTHFATLADARSWVKTLGISELYDEQLPLAMLR